MIVTNRLFLFITFIVCLLTTQSGAASTPAITQELLTSYRAIQLNLAKDDFKKAKAEGKKLLPTTEKWISTADKADTRLPLVQKIQSGTTALQKASSLKESQKAFETMSEGLVQIVKSDKALQANWELYFCPMYKGYNEWLQTKKDTTLMNPYWGTKMQQCGAMKEWEG